MTANTPDDPVLAKFQGNSFKELIALCPDGIIGVDRKGTITLFNRAAEILTGWPAKDVLGTKSIVEIYPSSGVARDVKKKLYSKDLGGPGRLIDYELDVKTVDGETIPIRLSAALLFRDGVEVGSVGFFHDLTVKRKMEDRLRELSITDGLTGLYNQRHFHLSLSIELNRIIRYRRPLSLVCFDLDHFKQCNDKLGHLEGDNVLRMVGDVLKNGVRRTDICFRYGGDEFFIVLPETRIQEAVITAEKVRRAFNEKWPYDHFRNGKTIDRVTFSMGVVEAAADDTTETLIKRADFAMYEAKRKGGDRVFAADVAGES